MKTHLAKCSCCQTFYLVKEYDNPNMGTWEVINHNIMAEGQGMNLYAINSLYESVDACTCDADVCIVEFDCDVKEAVKVHYNYLSSLL